MPIISNGKVTDLRPLNDNTVKSVMFNSHSLFGFTGVAKLPRSRLVQKKKGQKDEYIDTSMWLAEVLSLGQQNVLDLVAEEAEISLARIPANIHTELRRVFFVGATWNWDSAESPIVPRMYLIANLPNSNKFKIESYNFDYKSKHATIFSKPINPVVKAIFERRMSHFLKGNVSANGLARILVETIRGAAKADKSIGETVNIACIPKSVLEEFRTGKDIEITSGVITNNSIRFNLFKESSSLQGVTSSPIFVQGENIAHTINISAGKLVIKAPSTAENQKTTPV